LGKAEHGLGFQSGDLSVGRTTIRFFDAKTLNLFNGFKVKIRHKRYRESMVAFSDDARYFASVSPDSKEARLYNASTKDASQR